MNFSLRQLLLAGFGILLGSFILTSSYIFVKAQQAHILEDRLLHTRLPTVLTGEKLSHEIDLSLAELYRYILLSSSSVDGEKLKAEIPSGLAKIDQALSHYETLSASWTEPQNTALLGKIKPLIDVFRQAHQKVKATSRTQENDASIYTALSEAESASRNIKKILTELDKSQSLLAAQEDEILSAAESHLKFIEWLMILVNIVIGVSIALYVSKNISVQLTSMIDNAKEIANGNLAIPTLQHGNISDLNHLSDALNNTKTKLNNLVSSIVSSSDKLHQHSGKLQTLITGSQQVIEQQQQETDMIATAMNEMSATVREVAQNTTEASESADEADTATNSGHNVVVETVDSINSLAEAIENAANTINQLSDETNAVDTILVSISGIADQTNLLALNAAIEAARAGEQGRGFAVVADEVRTLAARTQESTTEIRSMLDRLKTGASNAVDVMSEGHKQAQGSVEKANVALDTLKSITTIVNTIKEMNTQIATAAEEQSAVTDEMSQNITTINTGSHNIVEQTRASLVSVNEMAGMASQLSEGVAQFTINNDDLDGKAL